MAAQILKIFDSVDSLTGTLAEEIYHFSAKSTERAHIALSGGSTPKKLFNVLAKPHYLNKIHWAVLDIFWGDERFVPYSDPESNYGEANRLLLSQIPDTRQCIYPIPFGSDPQDAAIQYGKKIREVIPLLNNNVPVFDWIILGIGTDGHTASIFPGTTINHTMHPLTFVATHPVTGQKRISFTPELINCAQRVTFLLTGADKATVIEQLINQNPEASKYPASLINPAQGILEWYMDTTAASKLSL